MTGSPSRPTLTIFTPSLSGFFFSEILSQLVQLCTLKQYAVSIIKTGSLGQYNAQLSLDKLDRVVLLRNAVHPNFAKQLRDANIPTVCVAHEYLPLDIPTISSNNLYGVAIAFDYLKKLGRTRFIFAGTLSSYDIRKRYEAFCSYAGEKGVTVTEDDIYDLPDYHLNGGFVAARRLIDEDINNAGIICGTALNSLGLARYLREHAPERLPTISTVGFDSISLIPALEPGVATVDQNMNLIAHKVTSVLEKMKNQQSVDMKNLVQPKIITADIDEFQAKTAYLATSPEVDILNDANYMNAAITMISETAHSVAETKIDSIMSMRPLFTPLLETACLCRTTISPIGGEFIKLSKIVDANNVQRIKNDDRLSICKSAQYPQNYKNFNPDNFTFSLHMNINKQDNTWGCLSLFGHHRDTQIPCSLKLLFAYSEWIVDLLESEIKTNQGQDTRKASTTKKELVDTHGTILWDSENNITKWDKPALSALGFLSGLDINIYEHMDLLDRVHNDDCQSVRNFLKTAGDEKTTVRARFSNKAREYVECDLSIISNDEGKSIELSFHVIDS